MIRMPRSYSEMRSFKTFNERFEYLMLHGQVAHSMFGGSRYLNQMFYTSDVWKRFRQEVILRDSCGGDYPLDLGVVDHPIFGQVIIHHIVPITKEDILERNSLILDLDNVVCCSLDTHNAIHYGDLSYLDITDYTERTYGDTVLWR